jgi:parallel beta-helix repeat protein
MMMRACVLMACGAMWCAASVAGPITPPPGPVTGTPGPEPRIAVNATNTPGDGDSLYRITQPGSYYLTGNVTGVANKHGIEIVASGVTLDLNGFDLVGVAAMGAFDGVSNDGSSVNTVEVRNGSIRNWGDRGVDLSFGTSRTITVENVRASGNAGTGISVGEASIVSECTASSNGGTGISASTGSVISGCTATANVSGIVGSTGCKITSCNAFENTGTGIYGSAGSSVINCVSHANGGIGIEVGFGVTIADCSAAYNDSHGFEASNASTITDCTAIASGGSGFFAYNNIIIRGCAAVDNTLNGIDSQTNCTIEDCIVTSNTLDGIECGAYSVVRNNNCRSNGADAEVGAGIHATANDARIEGNYCSANDYGIDVDGSENVIVRNTCGNNTILNFSFVANNIYGTIIDRTAPATAAVAGNAAAGTMGTTDANANHAN